MEDFTVWRHQLDAIKNARGQKSYALFMEPGCLARDTKIGVNRGGGHKEHTIEELYRLFNHVELTDKQNGFDRKIATFTRSWLGTHVGRNEIKAVIRSGEKVVWRVCTTQPFCSLKLTTDHKVLTKRGWVEAGKLKSGIDFIAMDLLFRHKKKPKKTRAPKIRYDCRIVGEHHKYARRALGPRGKKIRKVETHRLVYEAALNNLDLEAFIQKCSLPNRLKFVDPKVFHIHHKDHNPKNNDITNLEKLRAKDHLRMHAKDSYKHFGHGEISWRKVTSITRIGKEMTYDISCKAPHHNFVANKYVVHNSGKTLTVIQILREKFAADSRVLRTLIFAPKIVVSNWKVEFEKFSQVNPAHVICLKGSGVRRIKEFTKAIQKDPNRIFVTNYEAVQMKELYTLLQAWGPEVLVLDESHRVKNYKSGRSKLVYQIALKTRFRYILTGTPILNTPLDIFQQMKILEAPEADKTFPDNFFVFRAQYFEDKNAKWSHRPNYFPDFQPRQGSLGAIQQKLAPKSLRVLKKDCLDLPPLVRKSIPVELSPEQAKLYRAMADEFVAFIDAKEKEGIRPAAIAQLAITKALRLQQITSGFLPLDNGEIHRIKNNPRLDALKDLLSDLVVEGKQKVVLWACFKENYKMLTELCEKMKIEHASIHGGTATGKRDGIIYDFRNGSTQVLIGNQQALGIGVNLTEASYSIFYSRNFSLEADIQAEARTYRAGSEIHNKVTRIDIFAASTIDEEITNALVQKMDVSDRILDFKNGISLRH